jgi:hypothetical protein
LTSAYHFFFFLTQPMKFPFPSEGKPEMIEFSRKHSKMLERLVAEHKILPAPIKLFPNGLTGVHEGLEYIKSGKVSLVLTVFDPPL